MHGIFTYIHWPQKSTFYVGKYNVEKDRLLQFSLLQTTDVFFQTPSHQYHRYHQWYIYLFTLHLRSPSQQNSPSWISSVNLNQSCPLPRLQICPLYIFGNKATDGTYGSKYWFPGFGFDSGPNLQPCLLANFFSKFPRNPEAQGATSLFEDRWMASAPLNMSPLFAAGHVIATTTVDRFLMEPGWRTKNGWEKK